MPLSFMNETVTVTRAQLKDVRGTKVRDWTHATTHNVGNCLITAVSTVQDRDGRELQISDTFRLRAMYDADIAPGDRITWGSVIYEVDGDVIKTKSPTGRVSSTRCSIARWQG